MRIIHAVWTDQHCENNVTFRDGNSGHEMFVGFEMLLRRGRAVIPDIVKEQVWEIVAKRFEESGAKVICGGIYGDLIAFEYVLPDGRRGRGQLRSADYETALNTLADNVFPEIK